MKIAVKMRESVSRSLVNKWKTGESIPGIVLLMPWQWSRKNDFNVLPSLPSASRE